MHAKFLCETDLGKRLASLNWEVVVQWPLTMLVNSMSKDMVREWINELKKGKVAGPSGLVLTPVDKVGIDMLIENYSTSYSSRKGNIVLFSTALREKEML